jgi:hypothetical protein
MAPLLTHLVVGERVYARLTEHPQITRFERTPPAYGAFLLGCLLADVHGFSNLDRRQTHFASRLDGDGENAFHKSCANFIRGRDALLRRPWVALSETERAFVGGYLCHLATDEPWKAFSWRMFRTLGIASWADLPVPGEVILTAFSVLSAETFIGFPTVTSALRSAPLPDVLTHVPQEAFQRMWSIIEGSMLDGRTLESYLRMLERMGRSSAEVQATRRAHELHWEEAVALIGRYGGVEPQLRAAVARSIEVVPQLWTEGSHHWDTEEFRSAS